MEKPLKQCVGIDISKSSFTACVCRKLFNSEVQTSQVEEFENNKHGYNRLIKWSRKITTSTTEVLFLMEATGIYYEGIAYHLHKLNLPVSVILPNKVKHYAKSLNIKTKTDIVDARVIANMGAERQHSLWHPPALIFKELRNLTRLYTDLKQERTVYLNRLESENASAVKITFVINSNLSILNHLEKQIDKCENEIKRVLLSESWLAEKVKKLLTIKGIGFITLAIIIAETQGFALIKSRKQLASYAGYDVIQRESGTSVKGKTHISKKGNSRIRASLFLPALAAARFNLDLKEDYLRINIGKPNKMIGATALQRKLLLLIYTLWKNNETFIEGKKLDHPGIRRLSSSFVNETQSLIKKVDSSKELSTQDELPYDQSTKVLLRQLQSS